MNIGVDIRCLMDKNRTGVGEYTYELLNAIFLQDKTNQYYLFYNSSKDVSGVIPKWDFENVHFVGLKYPNKLLNLLLFLRVLKLDKLIGKKLDYFFSPNLNFTNLSKKVKHIQTIHDLSFEIMPECFTWKMRLWHKFLNPRKQCQQADVILTPSENTRWDVMGMWQIADIKIHILCPGLSKRFEGTGRDLSVLAKYNLPTKYILYLGTLEPRKNVLSIIQAYRKSELVDKNYRLVLVGGSGWKSDTILKLAGKVNGIRYIGYVEKDEKQDIYKNASLFVYPSLYEGFGLPVLEAMACGVPVITSNRSSIPEVVGDSAYLVNPYNVDEIAEAMKNVLEDDGLSLKMVERQKERVNKFSWDKTAKEFIEILNT